MNAIRTYLEVVFLLFCFSCFELALFEFEAILTQYVVNWSHFNFKQVNSRTSSLPHRTPVKHCAQVPSSHP